MGSNSFFFSICVICRLIVVSGVGRGEFDVILIGLLDGGSKMRMLYLGLGDDRNRCN